MAVAFIARSSYTPPTREEMAIRRARGFTPTFKAQVAAHDAATLGRRRNNRHTGITGGMAAGLVAGATAGAFMGGVGAGPGAVLGTMAGALLGGLGGHGVGTVHKIRADLPFNRDHGISMRDHSLITGHNARILSDPMYRAANARDHHAILKQREGATQRVNASRVRTTHDATGAATHGQVAPALHPAGSSPHVLAMARTAAGAPHMAGTGRPFGGGGGGGIHRASNGRFI